MKTLKITIATITLLLLSILCNSQTKTQVKQPVKTQVKQPVKTSPKFNLSSDDYSLITDAILFRFRQCNNYKSNTIEVIKIFKTWNDVTDFVNYKIFISYDRIEIIFKQSYNEKEIEIVKKGFYERYYDHVGYFEKCYYNGIQTYKIIIK